MIRRFNFLALIFGVAGLTFVNLTVPVAQGRDRYFPPHAFDVIIHPYNSVTRKYDRPAQVMRGDFSEFWYSKQLAALREEPLYGRPSQGTVYRLTWLRSFDKPMTFRWTISPAGGSTLLAKRARRQVMLSGQEGEMIGVCRKKESSPCEYAEPTPGERVLHRLKDKWQFFRRTFSRVQGRE